MQCALLHFACQKQLSLIKQVVMSALLHFACQKQLSLIKQVVMSAQHAHIISEAAAASQICTLQVLACLTS